MRACWNLKSTFDFGRTRNGAPASCATGGGFAFEGEASSPLQRVAAAGSLRPRADRNSGKLGVADCVLEVENLALKLRMISKKFGVSYYCLPFRSFVMTRSGETTACGPA